MELSMNQKLKWSWRDFIFFASVAVISYMLPAEIVVALVLSAAAHSVFVFFKSNKKLKQERSE